MSDKCLIVEIKNRKIIDVYIVEFRFLVKICKFGYMEDNIIKDCIVLGVKDNYISKMLV